eukprot:31205-Pelagococcus_subviridis.AAC.18
MESIESIATRARVRRRRGGERDPPPTTRADVDEYAWRPRRRGRRYVYLHIFLPSPRLGAEKTANSSPPAPRVLPSLLVRGFRLPGQVIRADGLLDEIVPVALEARLQLLFQPRHDRGTLVREGGVQLHERRARANLLVRVLAVAHAAAPHERHLPSRARVELPQHLGGGLEQRRAAETAGFVPEGRSIQKWFIGQLKGDAIRTHLRCAYSPSKTSSGRATVVFDTTTPSTRVESAAAAICFTSSSVKSGAILRSTGGRCPSGSASRALSTRVSNRVRCLFDWRFRRPGVFGDDTLTTR